MLSRFATRVLVLIMAASASSCRSKEAVGNAPAQGSVNAPPQPDPKVVSDAAVGQALNPANEKPYSGPVGRVNGTVHATGDAPPPDPAILAKIPRGKCDDARAFYGRRFREGPHRELGDVLVAVTGYKGYIAPEPFKTVVISGCAFESRTVAMTFGQTLHVLNRGSETMIPDLRGAKSAAMIVAVPGGDAVKLFPDHVGQFELIDRSKEYARADVFVLKYPTTAVTGIDGKFSISGIPTGEVTVSALLPATGQTAQQRVNVVAGETANLDLVLPWNAEPTPAPSASAK